MIQTYSVWLWVFLNMLIWDQNDELTISTHHLELRLYAGHILAQIDFQPGQQGLYVGRRNITPIAYFKLLDVALYELLSII